MRKEQRALMRSMEHMKHIKLHRLIPNMSHGDWHLISTIHLLMDQEGVDEIRVADMVQVMPIPAPAISRGLRGLEEQGLIERRTDPANRRITLLKLTDLGKEKAEAIVNTTDDFFDAVYQRMGAEEIRAFLEKLDQFTGIAQAEYEERMKGKCGAEDCEPKPL